jgi:hypothetical protein
MEGEVDTCRGLRCGDCNGCGEGVWWRGVCGEKGVGVEDGRGCREGRVRLPCDGRQARFW